MYIDIFECAPFGGAVMNRQMVGSKLALRSLPLSTLIGGGYNNPGY
jgi:hypothetical protein